MLCTKCGKEFDTLGNRCPDCGSVYTAVPPHRAAAGPNDNRFMVQQTSSEMITRLLVKNDKSKEMGTRLKTWAFAAAVALIGCVIVCSGFFVLIHIFVRTQIRRLGDEACSEYSA